MRLRPLVWLGTVLVLVLGVLVVRDTVSAPASGDLGSGSTDVLATPPAGADSVAAAESRCTVSVLLVPSCGAWTGVAPGSFTDVPKPRALREFEAASGAPVDIVHVYKRSGQVFPNDREIAMTRQDGVRRLLMINYKPEGGRTWAEVADGAVDPELDRVARHIVERYQDPFFFTVHHEPEEEVDPSPGSGYTATDYADMFRHVVERLRAQGVDNLVSVLNLMGYPTWTTKPWFTDLYPGDHVVDWIGWDPYACLDDERHCGDFARLVNLTFSPEWPGFYQWAVTEHRDKPLMLAEWGVVQRGDPRRPPDFFESVARQLPMYPAIKALVYFDSPGTRVDATPESREAFRELVADPYFRQGVP